jgi:hypothetical protein
MDRDQFVARFDEIDGMTGAEREVLCVQLGAAFSADVAVFIETKRSLMFQLMLLRKLGAPDPPELRAAKVAAYELSYSADRAPTREAEPGSPGEGTLTQRTVEDAERPHGGSTSS